MSPRPLISVTISFLNAGKYINEAIESVFAQTYKKWELLLVDDGSSDQSTQIALEYAKRYPDKVQYLEHEQHRNRGISTSRNLGISKAVGKYVATLDADDVWVRHKLEQQMEILETHHEAGMVCGNTKYWYSWTGDPKDIPLDHYMHNGINSNRPILNSLIEPPLLLILTLNWGFGPASMSNIMFRREIIGQVGGFEDTFTGMHEDQAFLAKVYVHSPVFVSASCWDLYRQHRESCHQLAGKKQEEAEIFYLNWLKKYLRKNEINDPELWSALRNRLWIFKNPALNELKRALIQKTKNTVNTLAPRLLPRSIGEAVISKYSGIRPFGWVDFGEFRRLTPAGESWGENRGNPIDRYYIDKFLEANSNYIQGMVLESGGDLYAYKYGGENVVKSDVWKISIDSDGNIIFPPDAPQDAYDCIIFIQTLQFIYNLPKTIETLHGILKPSGVILAAMPGMHPDSDRKSRKNLYWNFTSSSARRLFEGQFKHENVEIECFGNSLAAISLLHGLASEDLTKEELDYFDDRYEVLIGVRATKAD